MSTWTEELWSMLDLNLKRPQIIDSFVLSSSSHRNIWPKAVAGLSVVEALVILGTVQAGGDSSLGSLKVSKTKTLVGRQEGLLCGEKWVVLFITVGFEEETGSSREYLYQFWEVNQRSALEEVFLQDLVSFSPLLNLVLLKITSQMLKDDERA